MADRSESGTLEGEEFVLFYKALTQRDDVLDVFQVFSQDGKKLTLLEFVDFLQQEQLEGENTQEFAMELIARYEPSETGEGHGTGQGKGPAPGAKAAPSLPGRLALCLVCYMCIVTGLSAFPWGRFPAKFLSQTGSNGAHPSQDGAPLFKAQFL